VSTDCNVNRDRHQIEAARRGVSELSRIYVRIKRKHDDLCRAAQHKNWSELEHLVFEYEKLAPLMGVMDAIAMRIATAEARSLEEVRIKAMVILDVLNGKENAVLESMTVSLCRSIVSLPTHPH